MPNPILKRYAGFSLASTTAVFLVAALNSLFAAQVQAPFKDPDIGRYIWDLSPLYPNQAAWESERSYILQRVQTIGQLRGSGKQSASALADELDKIADLRTRAAKMSIYGELVASVDSSPRVRTQYDVGNALQTAVEAAVSFLPEDILAIGETRLKTWFTEEPRLRRHRIRILRILREAPHLPVCLAGHKLPMMSGPR